MSDNLAGSTVDVHDGDAVISVTFDNDFVKMPFPGLNEWIEALTSAKYRQGFRYLCVPINPCTVIKVRDEKNIPLDKVGMCCLGVLCHIGGSLGFIRSNKCWADMSLHEDKPSKTCGGLGIGNPNYSVKVLGGGMPYDFGGHGNFNASKAIIKKGPRLEFGEITNFAQLNDAGVSFGAVAEILKLMFYDE